MDISDITKNLLSQLPLIIMTLGNMKNLWNLLPVVVVPVFIFLINCWPDLKKYRYESSIPGNYVHFFSHDIDRNKFYNVNFIEDISMFLNEFFPENINHGQIRDYYRLPVDITSLFRPYKAIISPNDTYFDKIFLSKKNKGKTVMEQIEETGFKLPKNISMDKLLCHPIYLTFFKKPEEVITKDNNVTKINKQYVKISATDIKTVEDFVYIVVNYQLHKCMNIHNFRLQKYIYYCNPKSDWNLISTSINVTKTYSNVFLSKNNYELITNSISEWNKNRKKQLEKGIPNKLGFFFMGEPGCGKSSTIYAIANENKKHIVSIDLQNFSNQTFRSVMSRVENSVVIFEDIDAYDFTLQRESISEKKIKIENNKNTDLDIDNDKKPELEKITLNVFIDVLDGYSYLNNCIVILTSNHPDKIDKAIIRPGRVDHTIEFNLTDEHQFASMFKYFVGEKYKAINPEFQFKENIHSSSYIINTLLLPNQKNPAKIFQILSN